MIHNGDCVEVMAAMPESSVDAIVCDPPYGLEFMGKEWDKLTGAGFADIGKGKSEHALATGRPSGRRGFDGYGFTPSYGKDTRAMQQWHQRWATEAFRVAKPGAYLLAFGGTRTYHRLAVAIEDAGWIIRDCLVWAYASGFPKSKALLKPAWEPIVMARKPGPLRELAIDACRIAAPENVGVVWTRGGKQTGASLTTNTSGENEYVAANAAGRWPANVVLTDDVFRADAEGVIGGSLSDTMYEEWNRTSYPVSAPSPASTIAVNAGERSTTTGPGLWSEPSATEPAATRHVDWDAPAATRRRATGCSRGTITGGGVTSGNTVESGKRRTGRSLPDTSSTTETATASITDSTTSKSSPAPTMPESTRPSSLESSALDETRERATSDDWNDASESWKQNSPPFEANGYSRFFLIPKSARSEREPVFGGLDRQNDAKWAPRRGKCVECGHWMDPGETACPCGGAFEFDSNRMVRPRVNGHPTVKPLDLMRHLVRLVTPQGGTVLDPFLGSGTTAIAAEMEGFAWIGIEREAEYVAIAEARLMGVQRGLGLDVA
jgi:DNA modification methylase